MVTVGDSKRCFRAKSRPRTSEKYDEVMDCAVRVSSQDAFSESGGTNIAAPFPTADSTSNDPSVQYSPADFVAGTYYSSREVKMGTHSSAVANSMSQDEIPGRVSCCF